jgi:chemotaxis protein methyltransferase CheR
MAATGAPNCLAYLALARERRTGEQEALVHELTIGETHFFRFSEQFDALREVVFPELIQRNRDRRQLRIWSAGCSIGAEAYSLAILLDRSFGTQLQDWSVSILGTDIDTEYLARARSGVFAAWALRGLSSAQRAEYFTETDGGWKIDPRYQRWTSFLQQNLVQDPLPAPELGLGSLDLILCRNVMIYFDEPTINRLVSGFQRCLSPDGWLLVGHAEGNAEAFQRFRTCPARGAVLFQNAPASYCAAGADVVAAARHGSNGAPSRQPAPSSSPFEALQNWRPFSLEERPPAVPPVGFPEGTPVLDRVDEIQALVDRGDWASAGRQAQSLREAQPLNAWAYYYEGLVLAHTGKVAEAEAALRRALFLEPDFPLAYYNLGLLLAAQGSRTGAHRAFRNTLRTLEGVAPDTPLPGSDLTVALLQDAALLQLNQVES